MDVILQDEINNKHQAGSEQCQAATEQVSKELRQVKERNVVLEREMQEIGRDMQIMKGLMKDMQHLIRVVIVTIGPIFPMELMYIIAEFLATTHHHGTHVVIKLQDGWDGLVRFPVVLERLWMGIKADWNCRRPVHMTLVELAIKLGLLPESSGKFKKRVFIATVSGESEDGIEWGHSLWVEGTLGEVEDDAGLVVLDDYHAVNAERIQCLQEPQKSEQSM